MRQIVLDTETTGLDPKQGHRIIEIGCVEMVNRCITGNDFHIYIDPERAVEEAALAVHGISNSFLKDKPKFKEIADEFMAFTQGAEVIIHNAAFDVGFIEHELNLLGRYSIKFDEHCTIFDTLTYARKKHPGQRNSLDALCKRYKIDNSTRKLHGALLDAELLALLYLEMTGGQIGLFMDSAEDKAETKSEINRSYDIFGDLRILTATAEELLAHQDFMAYLEGERK